MFRGFRAYRVQRLGFRIYRSHHTDVQALRLVDPDGELFDVAGFGALQCSSSHRPGFGGLGYRV